MLLVFLAAAGLQAASAGTGSCVDEVRAAWPSLVATRIEEPGIMISLDEPSERSEPTRRQQEALRTLQRLEALCAANPAVLADLRALDADLRVWIEDYAGALAALEQAPLDPASPLIGTNALNLLEAAAGVGDPARFAGARDAVRRAHDAEIVRLGMARAEGFETPLALVDAYRAPREEMAWLFVGWPKDGGMPVGLRFDAVRYGGDEPTLKAEIDRCGSSSDIDWEGAGPDAPAGRIGDIARTTFSDRDQLRDAGPLDIEMEASLAPAPAEGDTSEPPRSGCANRDRVLPGFANPYRFTGAEYAPDTQTPTAIQVQTMLLGSREQQARAADHVLDHPDAVGPFELIRVITILQARGDMLQAAFWFYFWQIRSAPWARHGPPDAAPALRGALNASLGAVVNEWIATDPAALREVVERAIAFERRAPLYPGRPEGVSEAAWLAEVAASRAAYEKGFREAFPGTEKALREFVAARARNGLPNGPLKDPGKPLREAWR